MSPQVDQLDLAIMGALQQDPRASAAQLGAAVGCPPAMASTRLRRLLDEKIIQVLGVIDHRALGKCAEAIVLISTSDPKALTDAALDIPGVQFAALVFGQADALVSVVEHDESRLEELIDTVARSRDDVNAIEVLRVISHHVVGVPDRQPVPIRDEEDHELAVLLAADVRASFASLAETTGMNQATVRIRAKRLLDGNAVRPLVIPDGAVFGLDVVAAFEIGVTGKPQAVLDELIAINGVLLATRLQGRAAIGCEVITTDLESLAAIRSQIWRIPGVAHVHTHLYGPRQVGSRPIPNF